MAGFIIPRGRQDLAMALQAFQSGAESFGKNSRQAIQDKEERDRQAIASRITQEQNKREQMQFEANAPLREVAGRQAGSLLKGINATDALMDAQGMATGMIPPMGPMQAGQPQRPMILKTGVMDTSKESGDFLAMKKLDAVNHFRAAKGDAPISMEEYNQDREAGKLGLLGAKQKLGIESKKAESDLLNDAASRRTAGALADKYSKEALTAGQTTADAALAKPLKLSEAQLKTVSAAGMAKVMLNDLASQFKKSNLGGVSGYGADVVESVPLFGGKLAPKTNEYNDKKRIVAETFLREATGAAAPKEEVKFYVGLLPEPGDSEEQAQSSLNAFRMAVKAKATGVVESLRLQGHDDQAALIQSRLDTLFSDSQNIKEGVSPAQGGSPDRKTLAQQALNDPEATEQEKAQARRILGQ